MNHTSTIVSQRALLLACMLLITVIFTSPFRTQAQADAKPAQKGKQAQTGKSAGAAGNTKNTHLGTEAELEKAMQELERAMEKLEKQDLRQMEVELARAAREMDVARIEAEVKQSLKEVDVKRIRQEAERALKDADVALLRERAMREIDWSRMEQQLEAAKKIDYEQIARHMEEAKVQMEKAGREAGAQMEKAHEQMKRAQQAMKLMQQGMEELKKDGLLKDGEELDIEWDNNTLIINGNRQPAAVSEKYRKYFGEGTFRMNTKEGQSPKLIR